MPVTVSGYSIEQDSTGAVVAWTTQKYVYLQPSRDDIQVSYDGGTTWRTWVGDPDLQSTYPGAIRAAVNMSTGAFSVSIPYTDTEVKTQLTSTTPAVKWNLIDPNVVSGVKYYTGATPSGAMGASKTLKQLLVDVAAPDTWEIRSTSYTGYPYGAERLASVTFNAGQSSVAASWADIGTSTWKATGSLRTDDTGIQGFKIVTGTESATGCTVELSAAPASGKTARVDLWVRP